MDFKCELINTRVFVVLLSLALLLLGLLILKWYYYTLQVQIRHKCLYKAASKNDIFTCVQIIWKHPHLLNVLLPRSGYSPFMVACLKGSTKVVKYMITKGADVHKKSEQGDSPFYLAIYDHIKNPSKKNAMSIHDLYYAGADINETNGKGFSPLQTASAFGHEGLVKWLLSKGAKTNCQPHPYSLAENEGYLKVAALLKYK